MYLHQHCLIITQTRVFEYHSCFTELWLSFCIFNMTKICFTVLLNYTAVVYHGYNRIFEQWYKLYQSWSCSNIQCPHVIQWTQNVLINIWWTKSYMYLMEWNHQDSMTASLNKKKYFLFIVFCQNCMAANHANTNHNILMMILILAMFNILSLDTYWKKERKKENTYSMSRKYMLPEGCVCQTTQLAFSTNQINF